MEKITDEMVQEQLKSGAIEAEEMLQDEDKMERFLQRLEKKLEKIPVAGEQLKDIPVLISLVKSYVKKEYMDIPIGSIIAILSALIYFVSPIDLIPDNIPVIGYVDDMAVIAGCWKLVESDVEEYLLWRKENGKEIF